MESDQIIASITAFIQAHQLISIAALIVAACFFYRNPKESFKLLAVAAILAIASYFIMQLGSSTDTGVSTKQELSNKTKKAVGE